MSKHETLASQILQFNDELSKTSIQLPEIIALEHPRFITQYNSDKLDFYTKKYLDALMKKD